MADAQTRTDPTHCPDCGRPFFTEENLEEIGSNDYHSDGVNCENYSAGRARALADLEDFVPDAAHINALPLKLRKYIHDLETRADPGGDVKDAACQKDNADGLAVLLAESHEREKALIEVLNAYAAHHRLIAEGVCRCALCASAEAVIDHDGATA